MLNKLLRKKRGLTLVELIMIIIILGVIAAVTVPYVGNTIQKSKEDDVKTDDVTAMLYWVEKNDDIDNKFTISLVNCTT